MNTEQTDDLIRRIRELNDDRGLLCYMAGYQPEAFAEVLGVYEEFSREMGQPAATGEAIDALAAINAERAAVLTPDESEALRSGYLPPSAVPKVSDATRRYHGVLGQEVRRIDDDAPVPLTGCIIGLDGDEYVTVAWGDDRCHDDGSASGTLEALDELTPAPRS